MGSEHYCLRWNNHQSNLLGVFSQLLESESLVDVTLACAEGPSIRAHKVVLSACSSYFQALFLEHPGRHPIVILKDVRFDELRTLVDFMYKGEVNVEYCQLSALLKTAESLKVKGLADMTNVQAAATAAITAATTATTSTTASAGSSVALIAAPSGAASVGASEPSAGAVTQVIVPTPTAILDNTEQSSARENCATHMAQGDEDEEDDEEDDEEVERRRKRRRRRSNSNERPRSNECPMTLNNEVKTERGTSRSPKNERADSPAGPLALDRPRSRRDSDSAHSLDDAVRERSPLSPRHSQPSDMSLTNNNGNGSSGSNNNSHKNRHAPSPPPSSHSNEPLAGPSGLPPVQQVPLSLKKEVDWERSTEERSVSSEMSSDYRLPPDPVSLALGLEPARWAGRLGAATSHEHLEGSPSLLASAGFAAGLAGFARRCGVCLASFPSTWLLERHAILQHAGQPGDDKPFTCEQCGQRYRYRSAYVKHREQNHRARLPADKLFTCDVCGMQFRYLKSFKKHRLNHALERLQRAPSTDSPSLTDRSDQVSSTGEPSQHLESGSAGDASPLQPELEERGRETPALSEGGAREETACSSGSASVQDNPAEFESQQDEPIDLASGSGAGSDAEEVAMMEEERPPSGATMASSTSLNLSGAAGGSLQHHLPSRAASDASTLLDRRERRFACPFCGKCVRSKENLKLHVRKHTGERPFVCLFCGRAFGGKSDLTRHLRIHTGERPYHCEMCGKCFARADYLSKHLTTHIHQR